MKKSTYILVGALGCGVLAVAISILPDWKRAEAQSGNARSNTDTKGNREFRDTGTSPESNVVDSVGKPKIRQKPDFLLWRFRGIGAEDSGGRPEDVETLAIRTMEEGFEVLHKKRGLYIVADDEIWKWELDESKISLAECGCRELPDGGRSYKPGPLASFCENAKTSTVDQHKMTPLGEGKTLRIPPGNRIEKPGPNLEKYDYSPRFHGSIGPYIFVSGCALLYGCGAAHHRTKCNTNVWNLELGETVPPGELLGGEKKRDMKRHIIEEYATELVEFRGIENSEYYSNEPEALKTDGKLEFFWPVWTNDGLAMTYAVSLDAPFSRTRGKWGSYRTTMEITHARFPKALQKFSEPSKTAKRLVRTYRDREKVGWSRFPKTKSTALELFGQFVAH